MVIYKLLNTISRGIRPKWFHVTIPMVIGFITMGVGLNYVPTRSQVFSTDLPPFLQLIVTTKDSIASNYLSRSDLYLARHDNNSFIVLVDFLGACSETGDFRVFLTKNEAKAFLGPLGFGGKKDSIKWLVPDNDVRKISISPMSADLLFIPEFKIRSASKLVFEKDADIDEWGPSSGYSLVSRVIESDLKDEELIVPNDARGVRIEIECVNCRNDSENNFALGLDYIVRVDPEDMGNRYVFGFHRDEISSTILSTGQYQATTRGVENGYEQKGFDLTSTLDSENRFEEKFFMWKDLDYQAKRDKASLVSGLILGISFTLITEAFIVLLYNIFNKEFSMPKEGNETS